MPWKASKCYRILSMILVYLSFGSTTAYASVEIHEVQVLNDASDQPVSLVIYGTDFGTVSAGGPGVGTPVVYIGTQVPALTIASDQSACIPSLNPPPLDQTGMDCVVTDLPYLIPNGDYLLWLEGEVPDASCDVNGKPTELTFIYSAGYNCANSTYYPYGDETKHECVDSGSMVEPVDFVLTGKDAPKFIMVPDSDISFGDSVTVMSTTVGANLSNNLDIEIRDGGSLIEFVSVHASCSSPLETGDYIGSLYLDKFVAVGSGSVRGHYDLTIGAIGPMGPEGDAGPQGDKGDKGDKGDQGDQGKIGVTGDTGAQGVQGKIGVTGDVGAQGDKGETGAQGVQGKIGVTGDVGAQGDKGDKGDTGAQGVQGKIGLAGPAGADGVDGVDGEDGAEGPQGVQGKIGLTGPAGEPGVPGESDAGDALLCFSSTTSIGTQGKFVGLGTNSGNHADISIVIPFGARVSGFVAKASQGNSPRSGTAQLMRDVSAECADLMGRGDGSGGDIPSAVCSWPAEGAPNATCSAVLDVNDACRDLPALDSLSVHFNTENGSVEGGSACVTLEAYE